MNAAVSTAALALGLFILTRPAQAASLWSSDRYTNLSPEKKTWFLRAYRALGVLLSLAGVLFALDSLPLSR
jgi:hypothetical protein